MKVISSEKGNRKENHQSESNDLLGQTRIEKLNGISESLEPNFQYSNVDD